MANDLTPKLAELLSPLYTNLGGALTIDIWTDDCRKQSYMSFTAHFTDENFNLHDRTLAAQHIPAEIVKTGKNLRIEILKLLRSFKIFDALQKTPQRIVFITDRGSNLICGLKENERCNCYVHLINNLSKECCLINETGAVIDNCKALVSYIKRIGMNEFNNGSLKMSVDTRFNSVVDMLKSISENWNDVVTLLDRRNAAEKIQDLEKGTIDAIVEFLEPFKNATLETGASKRPTLYLVPLWSKILSEHLEHNFTDNTWRLISEMKEKGRDYFRKIENSISFYHEYAVFMHPLFKSLKSFPSDRREAVINDVSKVICYL